ncbi:hypothetical protein diail_7972, partial [Diaporthe ilicicola]
MFPMNPSPSEQSGDGVRSNSTAATAPRPMSVQFIDNDLVDLHAALKYPLSAYDSQSGRYVPFSVNAGFASMETVASHSTDAIMEESDGLTQNQALVPAATPMAFWDSIFEGSLDRFNTLWPDEPKDREKSGWDYSIRKISTWDDVYDQLQKAREFYDGDTKGLWGRYAKTYTKRRRWFVDHSSTIGRQAVKFVPTIDYATPVIAAVQVLVD